MVWVSIFVSLAVAAPVDNVPRWGSILPEHFLETVLKILNEGPVNSKCSYENVGRLEKDFELASRNYEKKHQEFRLNHPEIRESRGIRALYPELQVLFSEKLAKANKKNEAVNSYRKCLASYMKTKSAVGSYDVYAEPTLKSTKLGRLQFHYGSPKGLTIAYVDMKGEERNFKIDIEHLEQGIAEHTILEERGPWAKLPKEPFDRPVWLYRYDRKDGDSRELHRRGRIYVSTPSYQGEVVLERIEGEHYVGRTHPEEKVDPEAGCNIEPESVPKDAKPIKIPIKELFDSNGHIRARLADIGIC